MSASSTRNILKRLAKSPRSILKKSARSILKRSARSILSSSARSIMRKSARAATSAKLLASDKAQWASCLWDQTVKTQAVRAPLKASHK